MFGKVLNNETYLFNVIFVPVKRQDVCHNQIHIQTTLFLLTTEYDVINKLRDSKFVVGDISRFSIFQQMNKL